MTDAGSLADATRAVLLGVRLRAHATTEDLATSLGTMGVGIDGLDVLLGRLELAGLVEHRDGRFPGWRLTDDGRHEGERLLGVEVDGLGVRVPVTGAYERFLALNGVLLRVCTDWQLVDADPSTLVVNDHGDVGYDRSVLARLRAVHEEVLPVCSILAANLRRFAVCGPRFVDALDAVGIDVRPRFEHGAIDDYHATWFELHDHLLATLGIDRSTEPVPDGVVGPGTG